MTLSTSWQIGYCDADLSGRAGQTVNPYEPMTGSGSDHAYTAWIAIRPYDTSMLSTALQIDTTGTPMIANHGNGTSVQHSDGTGTGQAAFFDANGNITGTAQLVTGTNTSARTTSTSITNSWMTTGLVLPAVPVNTTKSGHCTIYWQMSSTSYTATFGLGMNNAPTNVWGGTRVIYAAAGSSNWLAFSQSGASTAAISAATTAGATGTSYVAQVYFVIQTRASNPVAMTVYGQTSNSGATLTIMPGSTCYWLP